MRKTVIILLIIVIAIAIAIGVYFGYQKSKGVISPTGTSQQGTLPIGIGGTGAGGIAQGGSGITGGAVSTSTEDASYFQDQKQRLSILTTQPVVDYWMTVPKNASTTPEIFYLDQKGEVVQIIDAGKENVVASSSFGTPVRSLQNIDGSKVIVLFDSGTLAIFDTASKVWQSLDSSISSFAFSPDGKSIAYIKPNGTENSIYIQNIATAKKNLTLISTLNIQDLLVSWPAVNTIVIMPKPAYQFYGQAWYFNLKNGTLNSLGSGQGLDYVFSQKANYGLQFISTDRSEISVSIIDNSGKKLADIPFSTLADKCSFAQDAVAAYCGIPVRYSADSPVLPDDYLKQAVFTNDAIYKIDLSSSVLTKIVDSETAPIDAIDLRAASSTLLFVNRLDGMLYRFNMQ
jgi:hypothetical protein